MDAEEELGRSVSDQCLAFFFLRSFCHGATSCLDE